MTPVLLAASICTLLLTSAVLPARRLTWVNEFFRKLVRFRIMDAEHGVAINKKNQFGVGQPNFDLMSFWLIAIPTTFYFAFNTWTWIRVYAVDENGARVTEDAVLNASVAAAIAGTICLSFFLIPVSRHSVLLVAMNWSPVHALRIHIWAGYLAYAFFFLHGITIVGMWFKWSPGKVYEEFIPPKECWRGVVSEESRCLWKLYNLTGLVAFVFYTVLWVSSFNWFRRKHYRLFYILHVVFGTLAILASIWHFEFIGLYMLPSLLYYLASTMPTLVQALASRFRGGVNILQIVKLHDAGDCFEVRVSADPTAHAELSSSHPSKFVKLCAPRISAVWHPFTVYNHPDDPATMRMMIRPIGSFTKALRSSLVNPNICPLALINGFYRGSDHCQQALMYHDHVSIITGGVAITPFISMIYSILQELNKTENEDGGETPILRSLTLIWSCREHGLLSFVKENYINHMAELSSKIKNLDFNIKIYFTGKDSCAYAVDSTGEMALSDCGTKSSEEGKETFTNPQIESESAVDENQERDDAGNRTSTICNATNTNDASTIEKSDHGQHETFNCKQGTGHSMELGRMMPARFSRILMNVPYFIAFSTSVWLGFHIMFSTFDYVPSYRDLNEQVYASIVLIAYFFGAGIVVEAVVLLFRKYWSSTNSNDLVVVDASSKRIALEEHEVGVDMEKRSSHVSDKYQFFTGRPSADDMLTDASLASAPGLFVCGPIGMTQMLRAAAGVENSACKLLTRYAIYEESFEM
jgi:predicted ferric reductase